MIRRYGGIGITDSLRTKYPTGTVISGDKYTVASDTVAATAAFEDMTASEVQIAPNPGQMVMVMVVAMGDALNSTATLEGALAKVGVSFDGGASYTFGQQTQVKTVTAQGHAQWVAEAHQMSAVTGPTGAIKVKIQIDQSAGVAGDMTWLNTNVVWMIYAM